MRDDRVLIVDGDEDVLVAARVLRERPNVPMRGSFMGDDIAAQYHAAERRARMFGVFTVSMFQTM